MKLIGVLGRMGSGKDTVADHLVKHYGFVKIGLADPIKRACGDWFGWDAERLWGPSGNRNRPDGSLGGLSARTALQIVGTDVARNLYKDVWVQYAIRVATSILNGKPVRREYAYPFDYTGPIETYEDTSYPKYSPDKGLTDWRTISKFEAPAGVVISDVRFCNEVEAITKAGGLVGKIVRTTDRTGKENAHLSETEQDGIPDSAFSKVLYNQGTLEELYLTVAQWMSQIESSSKSTS